jgi:predicted ribosome quality control (RQC) complex YloA/Tae2 family protein
MPDSPNQADNVDHLRLDRKMTPKITLSLMVTNAEELATMLALLRHETDRTSFADSDAIKHARAERDEAMANATGWQRASERRNEDYVTLAQHAESLAQQLEAARHEVNAVRASAKQLQNERDDLAEQLEKAQRTIKRQAEQMSAKLEALTRQSDAYRGERDDLSALLEWIHPDEDPHDHLDTDQCRSTKRREWTGPLGNQQWSVTYCAGRQGHPGAHTGGPAGQRETWSADDDQRDAIIHHQV